MSELSPSLVYPWKFSRADLAGVGREFEDYQPQTLTLCN